MGFEDFAELLSYSPNEVVTSALAVSWVFVIGAFLANLGFKGNRFAPVFLFAAISVAYYAAGVAMDRLVIEMWIENSAVAVLGTLDECLRLAVLPYALFPLAVLISMRGTYSSSGAGGSGSMPFWKRALHFYVPLLNLWKPLATLREIQEGNGNGKWRRALVAWWVAVRLVGLFVLMLAASHARAQIESGALKIQAGTSGQTVYSLVKSAANEALANGHGIPETISAYPELSPYSDSFGKFVDDVRGGVVNGDSQAIVRYPEFFPYAGNFDSARDYLSFAILLDCLIAASWILVISLISKNGPRATWTAHWKAVAALTITILRRKFHMGAERYYEAALLEVESEKTDRGVWAKAMVDSGGNPDRTKSLYLKYRARELFEESLSGGKTP